VGIIVREYLDEEGRSPYAQWFTGLNAVAAAKVTTAVYRMEQGNFSNVRGIGEGIFEYRVDFGPGYRIYFGGRRQDCHFSWRWDEEAAKP